MLSYYLKVKMRIICILLNILNIIFVEYYGLKLIKKFKLIIIHLKNKTSSALYTFILETIRKMFVIISFYCKYV